jgi:hypothetical protein
MCPVRAAAELVHYLYSSGIPHDKIPDLKLNSILTKGKISTIPSTMVLDRIKAAVQNLGKDKPGFTEDKVGTHSNRSAGAMGMYLAGTPVYTIMLLG